MRNPKTDLISQLTQIRQALTAEREQLVTRIAAIDQALGAPVPTVSAKKRNPKNPTTQKPGIKDLVLTAVQGTAGLTIKEIQALVSEASPKSVEVVVHQLTGAGLLTKDSSTPRRFSKAKSAA